MSTSHSKIGIIITSFLRDELLQQSIQSLKANWQEGFEVIIVDQDPTEDKLFNYSEEHIYYYGVPFNVGLSYSRNFGVKKANELGCEYILLGSESFKFDTTLQNIYKIVDILKSGKYDIIGFELENCICAWEAYMRLIPRFYFELDFIDKKKLPSYIQAENNISIWNCDLMRNFFLAKIDPLLIIKWDENLKLREHEDAFFRWKMASVSVGWTNYITAFKMTDRPDKYKKLRDENMLQGLKYLQQKWDIKNWIYYKNFNKNDK